MQNTSTLNGAFDNISSELHAQIFIAMNSYCKYLFRKVQKTLYSYAQEKAVPVLN
jgi:hypothetical protein